MKKSVLIKSILRDSKLRKIKYIINGFIASIIYFIIPPTLRKKQYWLIGGHLGEIYDDNSKVLFEFLLENKKKKDVFWVLNKDSLADKSNTYRDNIIYRGSIKGFLYSFRSECIIVSHSFADVMPIFYKFKKLFNIKSVFLFHGIYGFKKAVTLDKNYYSYFDIINAVGNFEKNIKVKYLRIDEEKIKIMGLPRYDKLFGKNEYNGNIMVMFTWRSYIGEEGNDSDYFKQIKSFLTNREFLKVLEENKVIVNVVLHSFVHKYYSFVKQLESKNIKILSKDTDIQNELISNSLLITDYSSVAWDFAYMNKPVIFYQFDLEKYLSSTGSYLDLKNELFGKTASNENDLIKTINEYICNNFKQDQKQYNIVKDFLKYNDNNNCNRIYKEISKLVK